MKKEQAKAKAMPAMQAEREESSSCDSDHFLRKVIGVDASKMLLSKEKFKKCSKNVSLCFCVSWMHEHHHIESKKPDVVPVAKECKTGFCVDTANDVGDDSLTTKKPSRSYQLWIISAQRKAASRMPDSDCLPMCPLRKEHQLVFAWVDPMVWNYAT